MICVSPLLIEILNSIMKESLFAPFRLVGGTNLALRFKHRESTDIDLFTDCQYGSLNFYKYEEWFKKNYSYFEPTDTSSKVGMGKTYYIGSNKENAIKIDLIYESESFIYPFEEIGNVRMAKINEIAIMKLDAIFYGGRKKDFWDLHYLLVDHELNLTNLVSLHKERFPFQHDFNQMTTRLQDFTRADEDPDPLCNLGKSWDMIKLDILDFSLELSQP